ncbi:MAG: hypothetical protein OHK0052_11230 [Anaerolineales bacterium]
MRKILFGFLLIALTLSACAPVSTATPSPTQPPTTAPAAPAALPTVRPDSELPLAQAPDNLADLIAAGCTVAEGGLFPDTPSPFPAISASDWVLGAKNPKMTVIEYSDFECPFCAQIAPLLKQFIAENPEDVQVVFRHFPLVSIHNKALLAAQAAEAAGKQGKFWEMHDLLFSRQAEWSGIDPVDFPVWLEKAARDLGLNAAQFKTDLNSEAVVAIAQKSWEDGQTLGLPGTPFLAINGQPYDGPRDLANLTAILSLIKLEDRQFTTCPKPMLKPGKQYRATIETEKGNIVILLYADQAPIAVNNFVFLAKNGWYDGVTFHRVLDGFVAQGGDPTGTGFAGPGYTFVNETDNSLTFDRAGLIAMANAGPNTNGSQFFITYAPLPSLNGGYTIFGEVIEGLDVALSLTRRDPAQNPNLPPGDKIIKITIEER